MYFIDFRKCFVVGVYLFDEFLVLFVYYIGVLDVLGKYFECFLSWFILFSNVVVIINVNFL